MRLLCITDIHGAREPFNDILDREAANADVIILGGDITNFGTPHDAEWFLERAKQTNKPVLAVAGNCDSPQIDRFLVETGVSVSGYGRVIGEVGFVGVSAAPIWHGTMYEFTEEEIGLLLRTAVDQVGNVARCVVVSHAPPRDTNVDKVRSGAHVGSTAVREFAEKNKPDLIVCGHIHEARGTDRIENSIVVNCGPAYRGYYATAELTNPDGVKVELKAL